MEEKVYVKGREVIISTKKSLIDANKTVIIPREYDRIIQIEDSLFVAIEDRENAGVSGESGMLSNDVLEMLWDKEELEDKAIVNNICFYTLKGKVKVNKKVLAFYYDEEDRVFLLLDDERRWSIGYIDYERRELIELEDYKDITRIKKINNQRFLLEKDATFKIISLNGEKTINFMNCEPIGEEIINFIDCKPVQALEEGIIIKNKCSGYHGFIDYSGKVIVDFERGEFIPGKYGLYVNDKDIGLMGLYSYSGKCIIPVSYKYIRETETKNGVLFDVTNDYSDGTKHGLYSTKEKLYEASISNLDVFSNGIIVYGSSKSYGIKYFTGNFLRQVLILDYDSITPKEGERYLSIRKGHKYAIYDMNTGKLSRFKYKIFMSEEEREIHE